MKVIGHRGAAGLATENTFEGLDLALAMEVNGLETDVQRTKNGKLVLFHDNRLDKTTNGTGVLQETSWQALQQLDYPRAEKIASQLVEYWHSLGLFVRACGKRNTELMRNAIPAGVDGMTFDCPDVLLRELGRL